MAHTLEKKQATQTACESNQMLNLTGKHYKMATINMFTELMDNTIKEVKEGMTAMLHLIRNTIRGGNDQNESTGKSEVENEKRNSLQRLNDKS